MLPVQGPVPGPRVPGQPLDDGLDDPGPGSAVGGAGARLDWPGLAAGQRGLGAVVRTLGQAGQCGHGGVEAGVATPHLGLRVARDVAENIRILNILFTYYSSDNCLSAIPK